MNERSFIMNLMKTNKQERIIQAVYLLVKKEGLVNLSMSKIAKTAQIAPATIYIYYDSKMALLSQLYRAAKLKLDGGLAASWQGLDDTQDQFAACLRYFATTAMTYPEEYQFMMAVNNSLEVIDEETQAFSAEMGQPLLDLFKKMTADSHFKRLTIEQALAFTFAPIESLVTGRTEKFSEAELDQLVRMCLDALCV